MMTTILAAGLVLFVFGYYIGNQVGKVAHIRQHLQDVRRKH
ncbi:MAG: hypothetical protein OEY68_09965 [Gammaproteobacteria bacterium]|nr:hypothetical protein [Gammaproteobacteria bacterium]